MATGLFETLDGVRLRYQDEGHGPGVLFIHGWTLDLDMWDPQVAALCARFRCVRFDRRGFGLSAGMPSLQHDVQDALALCDTLGLERFACVGMSQGARVALHLVTHAPALLSCAVLDGPPDVFAPAETSDPGAPTLGEDQSQALRSFREQWRRHPLMRLQDATQRHRPLLDRMIDRYPGHDLEPRATTDRLPVDERALQSLRAPVLIIGGELDSQSRRDAADKLVLALPTALRVSIRNAGHLPNLDSSQAYNEQLTDFLQRHCRT
jgi:pimeloyl-ACP methyl ester carboxylesterase